MLAARIVWPAHVAGQPPVPHWAVLLAAVPALLLAMWVAVLGIDRLVAWFGWAESDEKRR